MKRQILSTMLALCMVLALLPGTAQAAGTVTSGKCGDNTYWSFNKKSGTLTISGKGSMGTFWSSTKIRPWEDYIDDITEVVIENGVSTIGKGSFHDHHNLSKVTIADSVTWIVCFAFQNCENLKEVNIPNRVRGLGHYVFEGCTSLEKINIPPSVATFGIEDFYGTPWQQAQGDWVVVNGILLAYQGSTASAMIPDGVNSINAYAVAHGENLESITIPNSVISIDTDAFSNIATTGGYGCSSIQSINAAKGNKSFSSIDGILYNTDKTELICFPKARTGVYSIPDYVVKIGERAFAYCNLTSVEIPDTITSIGGDAFFYNTNLDSVNIPSSVKDIGDRLFYGCTRLKNVTILEGITTIEFGMFYSCRSLTSVAIPNSVTNIDGSAFYDCSSLTDIYYNGSGEQWNRIDIDTRNEPLLNTTIHYNSTMPITPVEPELPYTTAESEQPSAPNAPVSDVVTLSPQKLTVDGKDIDCEKYNIGGNNYFKLRDLAYALNGTSSQFDVGFDGATSTVSITTGVAYTPNGSELTTGVDNTSIAQPSSQAILIDGAERSDLAAYNIGGSNFFQLRELGNALGFEVDFDAASNTAIVQSIKR